MSSEVARCALCDKPLSPSNKSKEHIIPNSIGGKRKVSGFICKQCNSTCGMSWDAALAEQMNPLSLFFGIERQRGKPQRQVVPTASGSAIMMTGDGLTLARPKLVVKEASGQATVEIAARTMDEAKRMIRGLQKKYPQIDVDAALASAEVQRSYLNEPVTLNLEVGGVNAGRSIVKSALALAVTGGVSPGMCGDAKRYLESGNNPCFGYYYETDLVAERPEKQIFHCVAVNSADSGLLLGYVELFSIFRIVICLSSNYHGQPISATYAINPITGSEVNVVVEQNFAMADMKDIYAYRRVPDGSIQRVAGSAVAIGILRSIERERDTVIRRAMKNGWASSGAKVGEILTEEHIRKLAFAAAREIEPFLRHLAKCRYFSLPANAFGEEPGPTA